MTAQAQFYHYEPEHYKGHFAHQPLALNMHQYPVYPGAHSISPLHMMPMHSMSANSIYTRANSVSSSPPHILYGFYPPLLTSAQHRHQTNNTAIPSRSPNPAAQSRVVILDSDVSSQCSSPHLPTTPPMSYSPTVSSPGGCDALQTPLNPMFSGLDGLKDNLAISHNLALNWTDSTFPNLNSVYIATSLKVAVAPHGVNATNSPSASCPSLSPSPVPNARSMSTKTDVNFCNPRDLTVTSTCPTNGHSLAADYRTSLTDAVKIEPSPIVSTLFASNGSIPSFASYQDLSDLESEEDYTGQLVVVNDGSGNVELRRPRAYTGSSIVSLGHASLFSDDFHFGEREHLSHLPSPPNSSSSFSDDDCHQDKRVKNLSSAIADTDHVTFASTTRFEAQLSGVAKAESTTSGSGPVTEITSESESSDALLPIPVNRRGRKQSLTEDPSKTFVCEICNRRFRRQEHLKRHYRSLHTKDKPFECPECGKTFSRSDNLAQHSRTHGSGAIGMDLISDCSDHSYNPIVLAGPPEYHSIGKVLYHIAADMSSSSLEDRTSDQGRRKRRRTD